MLAEINHKISNYQEDELTGNFFGTMRYMSFSKGLNQILKHYVRSEDSVVLDTLNQIYEDEFEFEFWKRSEKRLGEIDGYIKVGDVGIGIEVKYQSGLSGKNQLEREAEMLRDEWCKEGKRLLLLIADEKDASDIYYKNSSKAIFEEVHLGYITWQDILLGLDKVKTSSKYEELMIADIKDLLNEKGFVSYRGFNQIKTCADGGNGREVGEVIHNAFEIVFQTFQCIEELMTKCNAELNREKYYMPADRFMRYSSDLSWTGWVYWSFILLYQRYEDGPVMKNGWINGPVYAMEINVDAETCEVPKLYIVKIDFGDISNWSRGCSPSNHTLFYNAIHGINFYDEAKIDEYFISLVPKPEYEQKVSDGFWGLKKLIRYEQNLVDIEQNNYKEKIFGAIEELSKYE